MYLVIYESGTMEIFEALPEECRSAADEGLLQIVSLANYKEYSNKVWADIKINRNAYEGMEIFGERQW